MNEENKRMHSESMRGRYQMEMRENHQACEPSGETLYKIGMFAALNHVTVKTLRFYEDRGLLVPAYISEENGYRYYTLSQCAELHRISALKQVGFTLDEITYLNAGSAEETVLAKKKSEILSQIAELAKQLANIDGYLAKKEGSLRIPVLVKKIDAVTIAYMEKRLSSYDVLFDIMPEMGERMEQAGCECALPEYCFTAYLDPEYKQDDISAEICQAVKEAKKSDGKLQFKVLPETQAACVFHKGSYGRIAESYEVALRYIEDNGYEIAGPIRESYIDGIWNKEDEDQWLTEIQIPVVKRG